MNQDNNKQTIETGNAVLGIEFGSTRVKAVLVGKDYSPIEFSSFTWENQFENGIWTYNLEDVWRGLQACYQNLSQKVKKQTRLSLKTLGAIGISGMMHGYLAFDPHDDLLVPFRTWRNTITEEASKALTDLFQFNIPQRWSIAHLYQAILNKEPHVKDIHYLTTLAGYVHWQLTGEKVLGIGEASGVFPIDSKSGKFDEHKIELFNKLLLENGISWKLEDILPKVLMAGEEAGRLSEEGAQCLDPLGDLQAGVPLCPPEGDAGTGMVATNSITERTGNVSAGTSVFAMLVLDKPLKKVHPEIDMVTTPTGKPVAMVHSNNCTSDLNAWVRLFKEYTDILGVNVSQDDLFGVLFRQALTGDADAGGLLAFNTLAGEPITGLEEGRPLFVRTTKSNFTLANFMRAHLFSALATLKVGLDILQKEEKVEIDQILGHGGFFRTENVGQRIMAAAMGVPVTVMTTGGEGGPWGMALLASYMRCENKDKKSLESFLLEKVFGEQESMTVEPDPEDIAGFSSFMENYKKGLAVERTAVDVLN